MKLFKRGGFTLVEVVIAAGLLGVVSLGVVHLIKNVSGIQKRAEQVMNSEQITRRIDGFIRDAKSCKNTFSGLSFSSIDQTIGTKSTHNAISVPAIVDASGNDVYVVPQDINFGNIRMAIVGLQIDKDSFQATDAPYPNAADAGHQYINGIASLRVILRKGSLAQSDEALKKNSIGSINLTRTIAMSVTVDLDDSNAIESCSLESGVATGTSCEADELLLGDGTCVKTIDLVANQTKCAANEVLLGGNCQDIQTYIDNAVQQKLATCYVCYGYYDKTGNDWMREECVPLNGGTGTIVSYVNGGGDKAPNTNQWHSTGDDGADQYKFYSKCN